MLEIINLIAKKSQEKGYAFLDMITNKSPS